MVHLTKGMNSVNPDKNTLDLHCLQKLLRVNVGIKGLSNKGRVEKFRVGTITGMDEPYVYFGLAQENVHFLYRK